MGHAKPALKQGKTVRQKALKSEQSFGPRFRFDRATGLYKQRVRVTNDSGGIIAGFKLQVSGTGNKLTLLDCKRSPGGGTYSYNHSLAAGETVTVTLRYQPKRCGDVRKPKVAPIFILPPPVLPPVQGEVVTAGTGGLTISGGTGCQTILAGTLTLTGATIIPDGTTLLGPGSSAGTLEFVGGDLVVDGSGLVTELLGPMDPALAAEWLYSFDSRNVDRLIPDPEFWNFLIIDPSSNDPWGVDLAR